MMASTHPDALASFPWLPLGGNLSGAFLLPCGEPRAADGSLSGALASPSGTAPPGLEAQPLADQRGADSVGSLAAEQRCASFGRVGGLSTRNGVCREPGSSLVLKPTLSRVGYDIYLFSRVSGFKVLEELIEAETSFCLSLSFSVSISVCLPASLSLSC